MVGMELLRSAAQAANVSGRRNFVILSSRLAAKKKSGSESSGSTSGSSSSGGDVVAKVPDPPATIFKQPKTDKVGPGASKDGDYKNPEYFSYHDMSYFDLDVVMKDLRCPQPSALKR